MSRDPLHIVWFKRDLRIADHRPLAGAAAAGRSVLPLYIAEPGLWAEPDMAGRHWAFIAESLAELRGDLARLGQPLVLRVGEAVPVLQALQKSHGIAALWSHQETGNAWTFERDRAVAAWCRAEGIPWHQPRQHGVIRGLKSRDGWARAWDRFMAEPVTAPPQALKPVDGLDPGTIPDAGAIGILADLCPDRQPGGRRQARTTLDSFLTERGKTYRSAMSSPLGGEAACSRLSPHFAWGTLSMREAAQATWARQRALKQEGRRDGWRGSMNSFSGRLHWHCHFSQKLEDAPSMEHLSLHPATRGLRPEMPDAEGRARLDAWCKGETGLPFVDACMRYLIAGGWLNFRMRAMLMAVASYHLWLHWREPGLHLARVFTDYEPGIHWPQVQMQSGTTGINTVRIYNPVKQGHDQDPDGTFTRAWLPELAEVPDRFLQEPWRWERADRVLDKIYPAPIVDVAAAAKEARQKVWAVRKGREFREAANEIQSKHGSRKSGIPNTGRRGRPADHRQQSFDL
jgi:deoxyribodipyrimidine photo-lyase